MVGASPDARVFALDVGVAEEHVRHSKGNPHRWISAALLTQMVPEIATVVAAVLILSFELEGDCWFAVQPNGTSGLVPLQAWYVDDTKCSSDTIRWTLAWVRVVVNGEPIRKPWILTHATSMLLR